MLRPLAAAVLLVRVLLATVPQPAPAEAGMHAGHAAPHAAPARDEERRADGHGRAHPCHFCRVGDVAVVPPRAVPAPPTVRTVEASSPGFADGHVRACCARLRPPARAPPARA